MMSDLPPAQAHPRLSLNQKTTEYWGVNDVIVACQERGVGWIGLWREHLEAEGVESAARLVEQANMGVSSLCRGGFFPQDTDEEFRAALDDNRRAIDEADAVGTDTLVLVCGGIAGGDLDRSRQQVAEGISELVPYAQATGVRLAIEPLHPMFCADKSVIVTLRQALDLAEQFPEASVGVIIDSYHVWWDPEIWEQVARAGSRIFGYQVCDWLDPLPDRILGRGMMGDGVIDFDRLTDAVQSAGYTGPIEVEIFNQRIWDSPGDEVLALVINRFDRLIAR